MVYYHRKRERGDNEDDPEFMPLSKRINNIHLSPERIVNGHGSGAVVVGASHVEFNNPNIYRPSSNSAGVLNPNLQVEINSVHRLPDINGSNNNVSDDNLVAWNKSFSPFL